MKYSPNNNRLSPKILFIILCVLCLGAVTASALFPNITSPFQTIAGVTVVPMQKGINRIGTEIGKFFDQFESIQELQAENEELQKRVDNILLENHALSQDQNELERLRSLYQLDKKYSDYDKVAASIISSGSSNWFNTFIIDKGKKDGIKKNMNVIAGSGLVGIVTEVGPNHAQVRSIIDDSSNVAAMFSRTSDFCILVGSQKQIEEGYINVININKDAKVKDGDELVTSPTSSKFLPGITIGYVKDVKVESSNLEKSAKLEPVVDFKHLREVFVIKELKEQPKLN